MRSTPSFGWVALLALPLVAAGPFGRRKPPPPPETETPAPPDAKRPVKADLRSLWEEPPPVVVGGVPTGLATLSAQGCAACHFEAHAGWQGSAHATAWASERFRDAVEAAATPACTVCHLPLAAQHAEQASYPEGDLDAPTLTPNPGYDAALHAEGVTCAACHVRDGRVVTARPVERAPHPTLTAPVLATSETCATCHQLTWPGADKPLYDTYGEWSRSPQAKAGIQCQDCHMGPGAAVVRTGSDHGFPVGRDRAVSLILDLDRPSLTRGGDPLEVVVGLQNTGAGHHFPTGSPFKGVRLTAALEVETEEGVVQGGGPLVVDLERTLEEEPPWRTVEDTRLAAGEERRWSWSPALSLDEPGGDWWLVVRLQPTTGGAVDEAVLLERRIPLQVD